MLINIYLQMNNYYVDILEVGSSLPQMELDYDTFKSGFIKNHSIRIRAGAKNETKVTLGVWKGHHVALKSCSKKLETQIYSKIPPHPFIVSLEAVMKRTKGKKERYYLLMEANRSGMNLEDDLFFGNKNIDDALHIMIQVTSALKHLHDCGLIHHDVKKSNILVMNDRDDNYKLCDFGLTEFTDIQGRGKSKRRFNGTPGYRAPEQEKDSELSITQKIDIYALAKVGKSILSEEESEESSTYDCENDYCAAENYEDDDENCKGTHLDGKTTCLTQEEREQNERVIELKREGYNEIMDKCLSVNPDDRYDSSELLEKLQGLLLIK